MTPCVVSPPQVGGGRARDEISGESRMRDTPTCTTTVFLHVRRMTHYGIMKLRICRKLATVAMT